MNGAAKEYLGKLRQTINKIEKSLYVDDFVTGEVNTEKVKKIRETSEKIFREADIELHKWHSNAKELVQTQEEHSSKLSHTKQKFETCPTDCKILGITWDKSKDTFGVNFDIPVNNSQKMYVETLSIYFRLTWVRHLQRSM